MLDDRLDQGRDGVLGRGDGHWQALLDGGPGGDRPDTGHSREEMTKLIGDPVVACIGPITARTAVEQGLPVTITAAKNTIPALVQAIVQHWSRPASRRS